MAKGKGISAGSVIKWTLIAAVVYVVYRFVVSWTARATASLSGTGSGSVISSPTLGSYASPGGYAAPVDPGIPVIGGPVAPAPITAPIVSGNWWNKITGSPILGPRFTL